jgi:DNA polymerase-3 subunit beta
MELKIAREELSRALYRAQGIVERKTTMPILSNVLLEAGADGLVVSAFDTEIGLTSRHRCEVLKEGAAALPGRYLHDIVRALPEPTLRVKRTPNGQIELVSGAARFRIVSTAAKDFPPLPTAEGVHFLTASADDLTQMIERTSFAISADETRYNLGGVYVEQEGQTLRMVATDGHRLALAEKTLKGGSAEAKLGRGVIIPKKGLLELRRLVSEEGGECELGFTPRSVVYRREGVQMVVRLLDGVFPDYRQVIPREHPRRLTLHRVLFAETLRRVSLVAADKASGVKFDVGENKLTLSSQNPDLGEAQEEMETKVEGAAMQMGFNARYILDVLNVLACEEVSLELSDELSPGLLKPIGEPGYLAVVMPMRI